MDLVSIQICIAQHTPTDELAHTQLN